MKLFACRYMTLLRFVMPNRNLAVVYILLFLSGCSVLPVKNVTCKHHHTEEVLNLITLLESRCDNTGGCDLSFRSHRSLGQWSFLRFTVEIPSLLGVRKAFSVNLKTYGKEGSKYLTSSLSGEKSFLENVIVHVRYKGHKYCFVSSKMKLKYNNKQNEMVAEFTSLRD